jgi:hypothetical protein
MVKKVEYDFTTYTSFPSSIKLINDEGRKSRSNTMYVH